MKVKRIRKPLRKKRDSKKGVRGDFAPKNRKNINKKDYPIKNKGSKKLVFSG